MSFLLKIRLSWFFVFFFAVYFGLTFILDTTIFTLPTITLFSVNSFLYGFYTSPIMTSQKQRIEELNKIIRAEANALFDMLIQTKKLPRRSRNILQDMFEQYITASFRERKPAEGEEEYERLISYCISYDGKAPEVIGKITDKLIANQQNRSQLAMQLGNKVFSNEWWIMTVLFGITIGFVMFIDVKDNLIMEFVKALLCTGLSMLMLIIVKLSTLTHKKAKMIWAPLDRLKTSRFRSID